MIISIIYFKWSFIFNREVFYFSFVLVSADISNAGEDISQSSGSHHESVLTRKNKGALGAEYYSFEKKKIVGDSSKDQ